MTVTVWHNPGCGTSRNALAMIRATGVEPEIVNYLVDVPDRSAIAAVADAIGGARALLRAKETLAHDLGLESDAVDDDALIDAMAREPILINRPVVFGPRGIVLARPSERVAEVLDQTLPAEFVKEDGERVRLG